MPVQKEKVTPERFARLFLEHVLEQGQFDIMYEQFASCIPKDELSEKHFCEYLALSLFIDSLCLRWSFKDGKLQSLCSLHVEQMLGEAAKKYPALSRSELQKFLEDRFREYEQAASLIKPANLDTQKMLDSLTALGEHFSKHFVGHESIQTILRVKWFFLMKEDVLCEQFFKDFSRNFDLQF